MTGVPPPVDNPAAVHRGLLALARRRKADFNAILVQYAIERLIDRSVGARRSRMAYPRGCRRNLRTTPGRKDSGSATLAARSSRRCRGHSPTRSRSSGDSSFQLRQLHQASDRRQIDGGHRRAGVSTDVQTSAHSRTKRQNPRSPLGLPRVPRESRQLSKLV